MNASEAEGNALAIQIAIAMLMAHNRNIEVKNLGEVGASIMETILTQKAEPGSPEAAVLQDMANRARKTLETIATLSDSIRTHILREPDPT